MWENSILWCIWPRFSEIYNPAYFWMENPNMKSYFQYLENMTLCPTVGSGWPYLEIWRRSRVPLAETISRQVKTSAIIWPMFSPVGFWMWQPVPEKGHRPGEHSFSDTYGSLLPHLGLWNYRPQPTVCPHLGHLHHEISNFLAFTPLCPNKVIWRHGRWPNIESIKNMTSYLDSPS